MYIKQMMYYPEGDFLELTQPSSTLMDIPHIRPLGVYKNISIRGRTRTVGGKKNCKSDGTYVHVKNKIREVTYSGRVYFFFCFLVGFSLMASPCRLVSF